MKMIFFFKRKRELSLEQFRDYYEYKHVPLALSLVPYFSDYRRNYIDNSASFETTGARSLAPDFDVITEISFASRADYDRMQAAMADPAISSRIFEDEKQFMDRDASAFFFVDEEVTPEAALQPGPAPAVSRVES